LKSRQKGHGVEEKRVWGKPNVFPGANNSLGALDARLWGRYTNQKEDRGGWARFRIEKKVGSKRKGETGFLKPRMSQSKIVKKRRKVPSAVFSHIEVSQAKNFTRKRGELFGDKRGGPKSNLLTKLVKHCTT